MRKRESVESETSKLYEQFSLLIEQEGYLNVDVVLSVCAATQFQLLCSAACLRSVSLSGWVTYSCQSVT